MTCTARLKPQGRAEGIFCQWVAGRWKKSFCCFIIFVVVCVLVLFFSLNGRGKVFFIFLSFFLWGGGEGSGEKMVLKKHGHTRVTIDALSPCITNGFFLVGRGGGGRGKGSDTRLRLLRWASNG